MTRAQQINRIRRIADVEEELWEVPALLELLDDASTELATEAKITITSETIDVDEGDAIYSLADDNLHTQEVYYDDKPITATRRSRLNRLYTWKTQDGIPTHYMIHLDGRIELFPKPSETRAAGLEIFYIFQPALSSADTDTPTTPKPFHRAEVNYALVDVLRSVDEDERAEKYERRWLRDLNRARIWGHRISLDLRYHRLQHRVGRIGLRDVGGSGSDRQIAT